MPEEDDSLPLATKVYAFFDLYLIWKTDETNFKAGHHLSSPRIRRKPPAIIVKFAYFGKKNREVMDVNLGWPRKNRKNGFPKFNQEKSPKRQNELKMYAEQEGLLTTTQNCNVKVFQTNAEGQFEV